MPTHFDHDRPFGPQADELVASVGLSSEEWQTVLLVVNPPAFAPIAALVLARIHGLIGHFPTILRLRPVATAATTIYEVAELLDLQRARSEARRDR